MEFGRTANRREQLLGVAVILVLLAMYFRVLYSPKQLSNVQLKTQVENLKLEKEALEKFTEVLKQKIPETKTAFDSPLLTKIQILKGEQEPVTRETSDLLTYITSQDFLKGIRIREMSDLAVKKQEGYQRQNFFIQMEGSFTNITRYLEKMEAMPALMTIDNILVKTETPKAARVELELNGSLFALGNHLE